ncbi:MAG: 2Fe-2S iron-sulfur cluster-binding protein [Alphaproteobacteria bacterium]
MSLEPLAVLGYVIVAGVAAQTAVGLATMVGRVAMRRRVVTLTLRRLESRLPQVTQPAQVDRGDPEGSWSGWRKFTIDRKVEEAERVWSYYLRPLDRKPLAPFLPGQHVSVGVLPPGEATPQACTFSLSDGRPGADYYRITIKKPRAVSDHPAARTERLSSFLVDLYNVGDSLDLTCPAGRFFADTKSQRATVLVAQDMGVAPIMAMLHAMCGSTGNDRVIWLFYGVRDRAHHIMRDELDALRRRHANVRLVVCYSHPDAGSEEGRDYDTKAILDADLLRRALPSSNYTFYVCAPPPMTASVCNGLRRWGVPSRDIHWDSFGMPPSIGMDEPDVTESASAEVEFRRSGRTAVWRRADGMLLDLAESQEVAVESNCRSGRCGKCATVIKSGKVRYLYQPAYNPEEGTCLTCISIPDGQVALDL